MDFCASTSVYGIFKVVKQVIVIVSLFTYSYCEVQFCVVCVCVCVCVYFSFSLVYRRKNTKLTQLATTLSCRNGISGIMVM